MKRLTGRIGKSPRVTARNRTDRGAAAKVGDTGRGKRWVLTTIEGPIRLPAEIVFGNDQCCAYVGKMHGAAHDNIHVGVMPYREYGGRRSVAAGKPSRR